MSLPDLPTGTVTLLFTDMEGSTRLLHQLGEHYAGVLEQCRQLLRTAFGQWHGQEVDTQGDAFFVVFARATDAVCAAVAIQQAMASHVWPQDAMVRVRIGMHTGEPQLSTAGYVGLDVHHAARIMSVGHGGQSLLSQATSVLVEQLLPPGVQVQDLGEHRLKDLRRPSRLFQLTIAGLPTDFPPLKTLDSHPNNLPIEPTPFIGREREAASVCRLLRQADVRLVTLTGPGGIGKTRLGLQVAAELADQFADGVFLVSLASTRDPGQVVLAIAQTLAIGEASDQPLLGLLKTTLREKHLLLLLDNFEQVDAAAPTVAEVLAACPKLKVLVTSRSMLHVRAGREFVVPSLALPSLTRLPELAALSQYEAVALFIERAQAVKAGFQVTNSNAPAVAAICARLDGLPLAIELAAARVKYFPPQTLLVRLEQGLVVLAGGARDLPLRQQTLRNTIAWSYDLLQVGEQQLFRRLAVFVGGFTLQAVQAICIWDAESLSSSAQAEDGAVLEQVAQLLDKSLVQAQQGTGEEPRFTLLETIREYATEQLQASGEQAAVQERHAHYFLKVAREAGPHLFGAERNSWLAQLEPEDANLRAALGWCKANQNAVEVGLRLAGALSLYWFLRSSAHEGRAWVEAMLARTESTDRSAARGKALHGAGLLAWAAGDFVAACRWTEESLSIWREAGDKRWIAYSDLVLGLVRLSQGNIAAARPLFEEGYAWLKDVGDGWGAAFSLYQQSNVAYLTGDLAAARVHLEESLRRFQEQGDVLYASVSLSALQLIASTQGDEQMARSLSQQSLPLMQQATNRGGVGLLLINTGDVWLHFFGDERQAKVLYREGLNLWQDLQRVEQGMGIVKGLAGLAEVAAAQEQAERAGRLFGAAARLLPPTSPYRDDLNNRVAGARAHLDTATFEAGWTAGQAMTQEQALMDALQDVLCDEKSGLC